MDATDKSQRQAFIYFLIGTSFTSLFIAAAPLPISGWQMVLSNSIAVGKWAIQIIAAFIFLREERITFIKNICFVNLIGSALLLPYVIMSYSGISHDLNFFNGSQLASVMLMVIYYYRAVDISHLPISWWLTWLGCQIIAMLLQITIVFHAL